MKLPKSVLIIDDETKVAESIRDHLQDSARYHFHVDIASDVETYAREYHERHYDVYIVDLQLNEGRGKEERPLFIGHFIVAARHSEHPDTLIIVYSAHAKEDLEQVVWAMRQGATLVFDKGETPASGLVDLIERELDAAAHHASEVERVASVIESGAFGWRETYAGKVIVVVNDTIVASGGSRLDALMEYRNRCLLGHDELPLNPVILQVPTTLAGGRR